MPEPLDAELVFLGGERVTSSVKRNNRKPACGFPPSPRLIVWASRRAWTCARPGYPGSLYLRQGPAPVPKAARVFLLVARRSDRTGVTRDDWVRIRHLAHRTGEPTVQCLRRRTAGQIGRAAPIALHSRRTDFFRLLDFGACLHRLGGTRGHNAVVDLDLKYFTQVLHSPDGCET
jgi:hypothetical protein